MTKLLLSATALALVITSSAMSAPHDHDGPHGGGANPAAAGTAGGHGGGTGGSHHDRGVNPAGTGGANRNPPLPLNPTMATPHAHGGHTNNGANVFGTGGTNRGGHAGRGHNNAFDAFRRALTAPRHYHYRGGSYHRPAGWTYQRWTLGAFLPAPYFTNSYWINDYNDYGLDNPPPGTVWVRYGSDALLIDRDSGEVVQVIYGIFY